MKLMIANKYSIEKQRKTHKAEYISVNNEVGSLRIKYTLVHEETDVTMVTIIGSRNGIDDNNDLLVDRFNSKNLCSTNNCWKNF